MGIYQLFKTLHIVGFTAWFAGLFYLVRMFVYHVESRAEVKEKSSVLVPQFELMEQRVYKIICNPGMMLTWFCGISMIVINGKDWFVANTWLHSKILLLLLLTCYHLYCKRIMNGLKQGKDILSGYQFRLFNEVPTLFLVSIVLLAVYRNSLNYGYALIGMIGFILFMIIMTKIYKKIRDKNPNA